MKLCHARTLEGWRAWLRAHHETESDVWLVFYKQHTGVTSIDYSDALDEALCFGWIDSLVKRVDEARYARKFTPRKADSRWSEINRKRYAALKAAGRLQTPGLARAPGRACDSPPGRYVLTTLPPYIEAALKKHTTAWRNFEALSPSHRRRYVGWIDTARQDATKMRRLNEVIRGLAANQPLGLK